METLFHVPQIYDNVILHIPNPEMVIYQALVNFKFRTQKKKLIYIIIGIILPFTEVAGNELSE